MYIYHRIILLKVDWKVLTGDLTYPREELRQHLSATSNMYVSIFEICFWECCSISSQSVNAYLCMWYFLQCPMYDSWHNITTGMKLEVINFECDLSSDAFWIATVIKIGGTVKHNYSNHAYDELMLTAKWLCFFFQKKISVESNALYVCYLIGYKALMRYEGYANDPSHDFWVNLCTDEVHPVGWCATSGKPLVPPKCKEILFFFGIQTEFQDIYIYLGW